MKLFGRIVVFVLTGIGAASPAVAHHAVQTVFDLNKPISVTGSIAAVEWVNPHSYISVDVKSDRDGVQRWLFELPGSGALRHLRAGVAERGGLKAGDTVTVEGIAAKDGTTTGFAYKLRIGDGPTYDLSKR